MFKHFLTGKGAAGIFKPGSHDLYLSPVKPSIDLFIVVSRAVFFFTFASLISNRR
jgi:hypothetical protein